MELLSYPETESALVEATQTVNAMLEKEFGGPVLFLASGGSSLAILDHIRPEFLGTHMTVTVSDERFSVDSNINNFVQIMATEFYTHAKERGCEFIDTRVLPNETLEGLGMRFDKTLNDWRAAHPQGTVLMTQGIGSDGHTCGIMPFPENKERFVELFEHHWAIGYDAGRKSEYSERITITLPFLRNEVTQSVVYVVGAGKRGPLTSLLRKEGELHKIPAFILREMKSVTVFTDQKI